MTPLDLMAGGKEPENFLNFQSNVFPENDVFECAYYFFCVINLHHCDKETLFLHKEFCNS